MAEDAELRLMDKISVPGNLRCKEGAPDSSKLNRRVITLLKELERDAQPKSKSKSGGKHSKSKKKKEKVASKKRRRSTGKELSSKLKDEVEREGRPSKKKKKQSRFKDSRSKEARSVRDSERKRLTDALKAVHGGTMNELRQLSTEDIEMDKKEKISRTKQCLLKLGRTIDKQAGSVKSSRDELWAYIHEECRTSLGGERMSSIYEKLAKAQSEAAASTVS